MYVFYVPGRLPGAQPLTDLRGLPSCMAGVGVWKVGTGNVFRLGDVAGVVQEYCQAPAEVLTESLTEVSVVSDRGPDRGLGGS